MMCYTVLKKRSLTLRSAQNDKSRGVILSEAKDLYILIEIIENGCLKMIESF